MKKSIRKGIGVIASAVLAFSMMPVGVAHAAGAISMDGNSSDWDQVASQSVNGGTRVDGWKVTYDNDNIYLMYTGTANDPWDFNWGHYSNPVTITGNGKTETYQPSNDWNGHMSVVNHPEVQASFTNGAKQGQNGNIAGPYVVEYAIPRSEFGDSFNVSFAGSSVSSANITSIDGTTLPSAAVESSAQAESQQAEASQQTPKTTYGGISVDGDFSDWDAVAKTTPEGDNVRELATMWDGDYFYIYAKSGDNNAITSAGSYHNGKFAITSDLGFEKYIQFKQDGGRTYVEGIDGAIVNVNGNEWEIAIPKSQLPTYTKSLNFGYNKEEPIIDGIMNVDGSTNENVPKEEMAYDGSYGEWANYPHTRFDYSTGGTNHNNVDANAALFMDGDYIRGHIVTDYAQHLQAAGGEFSDAYFVFNKENPNQGDAWNQNSGIPWKLVSVDADGNIDWNPNLDNLSQGTHEFYIADMRTWHSASNINKLSENGSNDVIYGKVSMSIGVGGKDEMEFYMETDKVAKALGMNKSDLKVVDYNYVEMGNQWNRIAGTSSGPVPGVIISMAVAGAALIYKKKRMDGAVGCVKA